jgi:hypothetical protein
MKRRDHTEDLTFIGEYYQRGLTGTRHKDMEWFQLVQGRVNWHAVVIKVTNMQLSNPGLSRW